VDSLNYLFTKACCYRYYPSPDSSGYPFVTVFGTKDNSG